MKSGSTKKTFRLSAATASRTSEILRYKPWKRTGGRGAYIDLKGMEGFTGMYVGEIPPGAALNPEHHLYEELIYIIQGIGATELWSAGDEKRKMHFEWQQGSLFAIPLNTRHRMINGSREPAFFLAVTSAPLMIDLLHNIPFVMGSDYKFGDRFDSESRLFCPDKFAQGNRRFYQLGNQFHRRCARRAGRSVGSQRVSGSRLPPSTWAAARWSAILPNGRSAVITKRTFIKAARFF